MSIYHNSAGADLTVTAKIFTVQQTISRMLALQSVKVNSHFKLDCKYSVITQSQETASKVKGAGVSQSVSILY